MAMEQLGLLQCRGKHIGNIANMWMTPYIRIGDCHLLAAELVIGESLYTLQHGLSPPPMPWWLVGL